jgi:hypothetical protein
MPKKTVKEFKEIFAAIKKPKLPNGISTKDKDALEKDLKDEELDKFFKDAGELNKKNPAYFADLVAYKLAKHVDTDQKRIAWLNKIPPEAQKAAIAKLVPGDISDPMTRRAFDKAVASGNKNMLALIRARDPVGVGALEQQRFLAEAKQKVADALKGTDDKAAMEQGELQLSVLPPDEIVEIASANPKRFFSTMLVGLKNNAKFVEILKNPDLRKKLKALNPGEWKKFEDGTPMLATLAKAEAEVARKKLTDSTAIMEEVFASVLDTTTMPLGYAATPLDPNNTILSGPTEKSATYRAEQKKLKEKQGDLTPDLPSTDCHHLLYITQGMMEMFPGKKPKIVNQSCPNMLMTKPLSTIPGRGILDRSFTGNVFDEQGKPTGMILFSGDNGINSHTWLLVDGVPFDPVLGVKGNDVAGAVAETFDWLIPQRLAKGKNGSYAVQDKSLKPATNSMGFSTGYYLTKTPAKFLTTEEQQKAKLT